MLRSRVNPFASVRLMRTVSYGAPGGGYKGIQKSDDFDQRWAKHSIGGNPHVAKWAKHTLGSGHHSEGQDPFRKMGEFDFVAPKRARVSRLRKKVAPAIETQASAEGSETQPSETQAVPEAIETQAPEAQAASGTVSKVEKVDAQPTVKVEAPVKAKARRVLRPRKALITLTPHAVKNLRALLDQPEPQLIRIGVQNRGCSGLTYQLDYVTKPGKFDEVVEQDGVKVFIDSKALFSIVGSEMDWIDDKLSQRFIFRNPNSKGTCGCGESFMV